MTFRVETVDQQPHIKRKEWNLTRGYEVRISRLGVTAEIEDYVSGRQNGFAQGIAEILGNLSFVGRPILKGHDMLSQTRPAYILPYRTVVGTQPVRMHGITEKNFYGGAVPYPYQSVKSIMHPLVHADAHRPPGWSQEFATSVESSGAVLDGYSVFSRHDLLEAVRIIIDKHRIARIKPTLTTCGLRQTEVRTLDELEQFETLPGELETYGIVVEQNLFESETYSVGTETIGDMRMSYVGKQRTTENNYGEQVYAGSDYIVVRGGLAMLQTLENAGELIMRTHDFDALVLEHIVQRQGAVITRNNYDVIRGVDIRGNEQTAVLEQSWRSGGATTNTILAGQRFRRDPALTVAETSSYHEFGNRYANEQPDWVLYEDIDSCHGQMRVSGKLHQTAMTLQEFSPTTVMMA